MKQSLYPLLLSLAACGTRPVAEPAPPLDEPNAAVPLGQSPELAECLALEGVRGIVAIRRADRELCSDVERCSVRFTPASTFKIPNTLIALETGVASGPEHLRRFDGVPRAVEAWNRDHTLQSAFRESVLWYYQAVARDVGDARMRHWVDAFEYGNRSLDGGIDGFWLEGGLAISPLEQVRFLEKLVDGELPVSARSRQAVLDFMVTDAGARGVLRAKTGTAHFGTDGALYWLVGYLESAGAPLYFATLIEGAVTDRNARRRVTDCAISRANP